MAETGTNGVIMNAIPRSGGNRFSGSALANGSGPSLQGTNMTDNLKSRGVQRPVQHAQDAVRPQRRHRRSDQEGQVVVLRDVALLHERVLSSRRATTRPTSPRSLGPTISVRQGYAGTYTYDNNGRVTWAINEKQKISFWYAYQYKVDPHWLLNIFAASPEAARITTWHTQLSTTKWTYAATNKMLFEVGVMAGASPDTIKLNHRPGRPVPVAGRAGARLHLDH